MGTPRSTARCRRTALRAVERRAAARASSGQGESVRGRKVAGRRERASSCGLRACLLYTSPSPRD
eukprot:10175187-Alexandrium_andersonii.AAC.1